MGFAGMMSSDMDDSIKCGQEAAKYILKNDLIDKTWKVADDGLLKRVCSIFSS
jgi:hypothetical protein